MLLLYSNCIRKLVLDLPVDHLKEIEPELSAMFPILTDVSISARHSYTRHPRLEEFPEWRPVAILLSPIRYLKLLLVKTPWVPGRFQNLVEFFIHDQRHAGFAPPMEIFLGILESSPQLAVLSVANAGPRLAPGTTTLPPATRVIQLHNLQRLYLGQRDAYDVGWILIHLKIPISAHVKNFVESFYRPTAVPLELVFDLALPNHPGFPHLTNLHRCTYAVDPWPTCIIAAPNFDFCINWDNIMCSHFDSFMMPFFHRAMAAGVIEDLTVVHEQPVGYNTTTLQWDQIFGTLHSLQKLRVEQSPDLLDNSVWAMFQTSPNHALQDLCLSHLVFGKEPQGEGGGGNQKELVERLVDYCAERNQRGCRLHSLVIEAPLHPPPGLASMLAPYVDRFEIREKVLSDENVRDDEFGSRWVFDSLRA